MLKIYSIVLTLVVLLTACVSTDKKIEPNQYVHVKQITDFSLQGKVGIIQGNDKESVNFFWQQTGQQYDIKFSTFLGIEVAHIYGDFNNITIDSDGKTYRSTEPEVLLEQVTGWNIPVRYLSRWIKGDYSGVVMAKHSNSELAKKVLARISSEQEWVIDYLAYEPVYQVQLPKKLRLKQYGSKLILSINEWTIN